MRTRLSFLFLVAALSLPAAGCSSCGGETVDDDDSGGTVVRSDGGGDVADASAGEVDAAAEEPDAGELPDAGTPDAAPPEARVLAFQGASPLTAFYGSVTPLHFTLTRPTGEAVPDVAVHFESTGSGGAVNVAQALTDGTGNVTVNFTAGASDGDVILTASAERAPDVVLQLRVRVNPKGSLQVTVASATRIAVTRTELKMWTGATPPSCAVLAVSNPLPAVSLEAELTALPTQRVFPDLTTGDKVTVLARGFDPLVQVGQACAENLVISGGDTTRAALTLSQFPTTLAGDYDVLLRLDLGNALPEPYDSNVNRVTAVLADPVGYAVYQALLKVDDSYGTSFIYWEAPLGDGGVGSRPATYEEVAANPDTFNTWREVRATVDAMVAERLGENYVALTTMGGDIRKAITAFEVGTRYHIVNPVGSDVRYTVHEKWNDMVFTWRSGCTAGDLGCARRAVQLDDPDLAPAETSYGAFVTHEPVTGGETERYRVEPELHAFQLNYGAIILIALNNVVFPNLPAGIAGNSLGEVLANVVDCDAVGVEIADWVWPLGDPVEIAGWCVAGVDSAAGSVVDQLLTMTAGSNPQLVGKDEAGVTGGGRFYLVDADHDLQTERVRDLVMHVEWNNPQNPAQTQDIQSPITGEGRTKASACGRDADCSAGRLCQAIPHYLQVQKVEKDCRRPVGSVAGLGACATSTECQSGLCLPQGAGPAGTCYVACTTAGSCASGSCNATAGVLDLDATLQGLGEATTAACVAN